MNLATIIFKVTTKFIEDYRRLITRGTCFYLDKQTEFAMEQVLYIKKAYSRNKFKKL